MARPRPRLLTPFARHLLLVLAWAVLLSFAIWRANHAHPPADDADAARWSSVTSSDANPAT